MVCSVRRKRNLYLFNAVFICKMTGKPNILFPGRLSNHKKVSPVSIVTVGRQYLNEGLMYSYRL